MFPSRRPLAKPALARESRRKLTELGAQAKNTQDKIPGTAVKTKITFGLNTFCKTPPRIAMNSVGTSSIISEK